MIVSPYRRPCRPYRPYPPVSRHYIALGCIALTSLGACSSSSSSNVDEQRPRATSSPAPRTPIAAPTPPGAIDAGATSDAAQPAIDAASPAGTSAAALPTHMKCLIEAYPEHLCGGDTEYVHWCDGTAMRWDDGREKRDHTDLLNSSIFRTRWHKRILWAPIIRSPCPRISSLDGCVTRRSS